MAPGRSLLWTTTSRLTCGGLGRSAGRSIDAGLNDLEYTVQATTSAIANHGERLARLMREAGFRYVFLGIENILEKDLRFLESRVQESRAEIGECDA